MEEVTLHFVFFQTELIVSILYVHDLNIMLKKYRINVEIMNKSKVTWSHTLIRTHKKQGVVFNYIATP